MTKALEIYHDILVNIEKHLLLRFSKLLGKLRPFSTKKVTHLRKPMISEEELSLRNVTLQHMRPLNLNSNFIRVSHYSLNSPFVKLFTTAHPQSTRKC